MKPYSKITALTAFVCLVISIHAQSSFLRLDNTEVLVNGTKISAPFAGGMNTPQFSAADLNQDGLLDLVVFDRTGDMVLTYLNTGTPNQVSYAFAPAYACNFPKMIQYALLRDYNNDGAADIFCASLAAGTQEIQVFRGYFENKELKFTPVKFTYPGCATCNPLLIYYPDEMPGFWNNLVVVKEDLPDINDVDGDGDLDILTFEPFSGGRVFWYRNMSVEKGFGVDSFRYELYDRCWGRFYETGLAECKNILSAFPDSCAHPLLDPSQVDDRDGLHPGSTLMTYDQDKDGDLEILLGDISFDCINMMTNTGTPLKAWMTAQDTAFPSYNIPIDIASFPATFYLDVDNDGRKDLLASPNNPTSSEDQRNVWFYKNTSAGAHKFELQNKRLFTGEMLDFGSVSQPAFADINADGLLDMVVGAHFYSTASAYTPRLNLLLNVGTPTAPKFNLSNTDFLGMSEFNQDYEFSPAFGDLDSDGDLDMLVGSQGGGVYHYRNNAGPGNPMQLVYDPNPMWVSMDVGLSSAPAIIDLDGDGLNDVILGERLGNINYFKNLGSPNSPLFETQPQIQKLGAIDTRQPSQSVGFSTPFLMRNNDGGINLITGAFSGKFLLYENIFPTADALTPIDAQVGNLDEGNRSRAAFADLDADGILEMVCGNQRGGLSLYKTTLVDCSVPTREQSPPTPVVQVSPNPARAWTRIDWPVQESIQWRASNALGQMVAYGETEKGSLYIDVRGWPPGNYAVELLAGKQRGMARVVVVK